MNDYELLYMIGLNIEGAYDLMIEKYKPLIYSKVLKYKKDFNSDYFQEGIITLDKAIKTYNDKYKKSFTSYFEMLLNNKMLDLLREDKRYTYQIIDMDIADKEKDKLEEETYLYNVHLYLDLLPVELKDLFTDYFVNECSIDFIKNKYNMDKKTIYYNISKIRKIIKKNVVK